MKQTTLDLLRPALEEDYEFVKNLYCTFGGTHTARQFNTSKQRIQKYAERFNWISPTRMQVKIIENVLVDREIERIVNEKRIKR